MELYLKNWYDKFLSELPKTGKLLIVSPFVKEQIIRKIQGQFDFTNFELITRFNLGEFASNVSSLEGLKLSVEKGASVYGIKDLHTKLYIFDNRAAIITSANLTSGGLINNYECGVYLTDEVLISNLHIYFNELKEIAKNKLSVQQCDDWFQQISKVGIYNTKIPSLPDYGSSTIRVDKSKNYYVKFFGTAKDRVSMSFTSKEEINRALCHYACGFSKNKKPRQIEDGDIIYMARMTYNPSDYAIFGKAVAQKYVDGRDEATVAEQTERPWKKNWPIYLRLINPVFINGKMDDCVFLYDLIKKLDYESFPSTQYRYIKGQRNINPFKSLSQQPYVKLTVPAVEWLEPRFQEALNRVGQVDDTFIQSLPQPHNKLGSID